MLSKLSKEGKRQWFNATWRLSIVWTIGLAIFYIIYYGWMKWPTTVLREDVFLVGDMSLGWWLVFLLKAIYPMANSFILLLAMLLLNQHENHGYRTVGAKIGLIIGAFVGLIIGLIVGANVGFIVDSGGVQIIGAFVGLIIGLIVGLFVGAFVGFIVGRIISKTVLPKIGRWLIGE